MRAQSVSSVQTDAYRAGCEIGEGLRALAPEVVLLFSSIHYERDFSGLFEGIREGLGGSQALIFGGTGDGIYETAFASNQGASALGLNSGGAVQWAVEVVSGVGADVFASAQWCGRRALATLGGKADFAFMMAAGSMADGSRLIAGLQSVLSIPLLGGLAGDDRKFLHPFIFANGTSHQDSVGLLVGRGPMKMLLNAASGWQPVGDAGFVEAAHDNTIERIGGTTALAFLRDRMGKSPSKLDVGMVPLATTLEEAEGRAALRTASHFDNEAGSITVLGGIPVGSRVQVCQATRADVVGGVDAALKDLPLDDFRPIAALVVSCAGRKWAMGDRGQEELNRLQAFLGKELPLAGFPSFGEIAPFRRQDGTYTSNQFHNVTLAVCLIGA